MTRYACALALTALLVGCGKDSGAANNTATDGTRLPEVPLTGFKKLEIQDIEPGKGEPIKKGDTAIVFYFGKFVNGTIFDQNMNDDGKYTPNPERDPLAVVVGAGGVIKGWDDGLIGAKEGTVRKLNVPWSQGYGELGDNAKIPGKADLIFTLKIAKIFRQGKAPEIEGKDTKVGTGPKVTANSIVTFKYKGAMLNGKVFDDRTVEPLTYPVSKLIPGFKDVIIGMQAGGKRTVSWPPGSPNPTGQIPVNQAVEYYVEMIAVK